VWWASSAPHGFFAHLAGRESARPVPALLTALAAALVAAAVAALAFVRATGSDGYLLVLAFVAALGLPLLVLVSLLGGLILLGPGGLGARAWEVVGWGWAPAGVLAVSLLPVVAWVPVVATAAGVLAFPIWHLALVNGALAAFGVRPRIRVILAYALAVFLVPGTLTTIGLLTTPGR
jgi:hypothetical protein